MAQRKAKRGESASIIIRREEIIEDGHHGGAWKVAYADFVTAMMAFFLLMWLINAVTEDQRRGIAAYFNPLADTQHSIAGAGLLPSQPTPFTGDASVTEQIDPRQAKAPTPPAPAQPTSPAAIGAAASTNAAPAPLEIRDSQADPSVLDHAAAAGGQPEGVDGTAPGRLAGDEGGGAGARTHLGAGGAPVVQAILLRGPASGTESERARPGAAPPAAEGGGVAPAVQRAATALRNMLRDDPAVADSAGQVDVAATPEGLRVQIMDASKQPMFDTGVATPNPRATALLRRIAPYLAKLGGPVSIDGYTDAAPYVAGRVSNWTLSSARADATEQLLVGSGLPEDRVASVAGHAGHELLFPAEPLAAANRRIVMVVRRPAQDEATLPAAGAGAISTPDR